MRKNLVVCDSCKKDISLRDSLHLTEVPAYIGGNDGIMHAVYKYPLLPQREMDFCSVQCLSVFAATQCNPPARATSDRLPGR